MNLRAQWPLLNFYTPYSRELAMVHARENIRVNSLCPGPIRTPLLMDFLNTPEKKNRRLIHVPMGRFGKC
jgi:NAD(P)-dependent dehydrogenase (short-subunit alcohol dehydrogenase family)